MADPTIPDWAQDNSAPALPAAPKAAGGAPDWAAEPAGTVTKPTSKPFKDEDFPEYQKLVRSRTTTPEALTTWLEQRGYGRSTNAAEVLTFARRNPKAQINNTYTMNPAEPVSAPDGMPQPGTSTDWLPDAIQGPIERIGLSLGIIDPKTYYGLGNYGPNARAPNTPTTVSNPALPSWGQRFVRSMGETSDPAGGGVNAYLLRANKDIADDDAIRHYGSDHNWTGEQIDAAIKEAQRQQAAAVAETRAQRDIRDNGEVRRAEGLGVDENGKARSSWLGYLSRGSADLAGSIVGDANPTYVFAPEIKGAGALVEKAAPVVGRLIERVLPGAAGKAAVPVAERVAAAVAPTAGRSAGQGAVQATTNLATQADEVSRGLKDKIDPTEVILHGALGAGFQGGAEFLTKLAPQLSRWIVGKIKEPSALEKLVAEGFDPADLPTGVSPKDAMAALQQLRGIRDEAASFKGTPEPKPTDAFPTDASRSADAEAQATGESPWKDTSEYEVGFHSSRVKNQPIKDVADYIASDSTHEDLRHIASRLSEKISDLQNAGMKFDPVKILNAGERGPASVANGSARGLSLWEMKNGEHSLSVHLRGNDLGGGGENFRTTTHEIIHSVTQAAIELGNRRIAEGTPLAKAVGELLDLQNIITRKFNEDAKAGSFNDFTRGRFNREHNGLSNMHELVAWGLTDRSAQDYLRSIKLSENQTGFSKFVEVLRKILGLNPSDDNALSRLILISDDILKVPGKDVVELGNKFPKSHGGRAEAAQETGGISKKDADRQFNEAFTAPKPQSPTAWGKSLEAQAAEWKAAREAGNTEPTPSAAARNVTAEAPPVEEPTANAVPKAAPAEPTTPPEGDVVTRLTDALTAAGKVRPEQDALTSKARSERLAAAREALKTGGVAGYRRAMAQLAGEVPKADFESVAPKFSPEDMDELVNRVSNSPKLQGYETIGALQGLDKLMNGKLPAANELAKLGKVFNDKFLKAALSNRTMKQKGANLFSQVWNLPRSVVSTIDASIPLRQGVFMVSRPEFYTSFGKMLKQMGSQKYFDATQEAIRARPTFQLMDESGLAIHDKRMLETRPEQFRSDWAGKIPVFKHLYHISERGAEGFSNQLRADVFDRLYTQYKRVGVDLAEQPELAKRVADYINTATGRGKVPFNKVGTAVGDIFFSPQLMSSRIQLVTLPAKIIAEKDPILRRNMMRDLTGFSSIAATVIALAKLNGAEVNDNPLSTDWGKIKVPSKSGAAGVAGVAPGLFGVGVQQFKGETRYDIFGGMQQYLHLAAVLAMNERTTTNGRTIEFGKGYKPETRATTIARFLRSKESPAASFINDALEGTDYMGNKFELRKALLSRLTPFSAQDIAIGYSPDTTAGSGKSAPAAAPTPAASANTQVPDWAK
jgi:hypothetical protein